MVKNRRRRRSSSLQPRCCLSKGYPPLQEPFLIKLKTRPLTLKTQFRHSDLVLLVVLKVKSYCTNVMYIQGKMATVRNSTASLTTSISSSMSDGTEHKCYNGRNCLGYGKKKKQRMGTVPRALWECQDGTSWFQANMLARVCGNMDKDTFKKAMCIGNIVRMVFSLNILTNN